MIAAVEDIDGDVNVACRRSRCGTKRSGVRTEFVRLSRDRLPVGATESGLDDAAAAFASEKKGDRLGRYTAVRGTVR